MPKVLLAPELSARAAIIFIACGSSAVEAAQVADNLVMANLSGHDSHGIGMLPRYVDALLEGGLVANAKVRVTLDTGALLALDGQRGYGQVVGSEAMAMGIDRAKKYGSCILALAHAHHLGRIGHFAEMAVDAGLVSLHFVNVLARPVVAAWGGSDGRYGTNPCCIGIPLPATSGGHFILDFATSRVAQGKMRVAHNEGRSVPAGLLIDAAGQPTTDPGVVVVPQLPGGLFGALLPFGEHKGYGLAVACELLGGALTGSGTWHQSADPSVRAVYNGMLTVLIDPVQLGTQHTFAAEAAAFIAWLQRSPPGEGFERVDIAGAPERRLRAERLKNGIAIDDSTWQEIQDAALKVGAQIT